MDGFNRELRVPSALVIAICPVPEESEVKIPGADNATGFCSGVEADPWYLSYAQGGHAERQ